MQSILIKFVALEVTGGCMIGVMLIKITQSLLVASIRRTNWKNAIY